MGFLAVSVLQCVPNCDVKSTLTNTNWQRMDTLEAVEGENIYPLPVTVTGV